MGGQRNSDERALASMRRYSQCASSVATTTVASMYYLQDPASGEDDLFRATRDSYHGTN